MANLQSLTRQLQRIKNLAAPEETKIIIIERFSDKPEAVTGYRSMGSSEKVHLQPGESLEACQDRLIKQIPSQTNNGVSVKVLAQF